MPTYQYTCDKCDHELEIFQSITAAPLRKCPACGKAALKRLIGTGGGLIFKGSGFYQTDYRSESYKKAAEAEKPKTDASPANKDGAGSKGDVASPAKKAGKKKSAEPS